MRLANNKVFVVVLAVAPLLCVLGPVVASAERLPIKTYTSADGLARDYVTRIVQDSKGFLWFCTTEGLSRFDGYKFTNYGTDQGLASRQVNDFLETRTGVYWAATDKGLCRFIPDAVPQGNPVGLKGNPPRFAVYYLGDEAGAISIRRICEDHAGTIWCATHAGLYRFDQIGGKPVFSFVNVIQPAQMLDKLSIESVTLDRSGSIWVIAQSGIHRLRPDGTVERYTSEEGLPEGLSQALLADRDGRIWVGSARGLYQLVPDPKPHHSIVARLYTVKDGLAANDVLSL
ncbi:MAG: ligand-binding sensor domain-containing protein, partial [Blastocatellia bacterium]